MDPYTVVLPGLKVMVDRATWWEFAWQQTPLTACPQQVKDGVGEREILGGQAAFLACARGRKSGYQRRKVFSHSSSSTRVLICRRRCAPRWLHPICCFFTIRLLTT